MPYPFVASRYDLGPRSGPVLGFVIHMAEGAGTVGYLSRDPDRGVSVHYVIETSGRIVQMLDESHLHGSINPSQLRTNDDPGGPFGMTAAVDVLGGWYRNPNNATIAVEIEGFAAAGPDPDQLQALVRLVAEVRSRFPTIGLLGHRDFQSYKPCPGRWIPWAELGGHGRQEDQMKFGAIVAGKVLPVPAGQAWRYLDGSAGGKISTPRDLPVVAKADAHTGSYVVELDTGTPYADGGVRPTLVLVASDVELVDAAPSPSDRDAILDEAAAAVTALKGA